MVNLLKIKSQINVIQSTVKITKAMQLIASTKFSKSQKLFNVFQNYHNEILNLMILARECWNSKNINELNWMFKSENKNPLIIVLIPNMGLCGDLNNTLISFFNTKIQEFNDPKIIVLGKKIINKFPKNSSFYLKDELLDQINQIVLDHDSIFIIFGKFISMLNYQPQCYQLMPFVSINKSDYLNNHVDFIDFNPNYLELTSKIFNKYLNESILMTIYNSNMSEYSSRIINMHNANTNANKFIMSLKLSYNRIRQTKITQEIIEIISGIEAMQ